MKKAKKYILLILCLMTLSLVCDAELIKSVSELQETTAPATQQETVVSDTSTAPAVNQENPSDLQKENEDEVKPSEELVKNAIKHKVPMGKEKIIKKFLLAMLCVAGSCGFLYLILMLINKLKRNKSVTSRIITDYENTLDTPQNINDAINIFLNKNKL